MRRPDYNDFAPFSELFATADLRFVNLECPLSDQNGETQSPASKLIFTGPPSGADALKRGGVDIVSLANNHAWDYGRPALFETFSNLERVEVAYVGAGRTRELAWQARVINRNGLDIAFVAVTDIWNQAFNPHPGKEFVADAADRSAIVETIAHARKQADVVVASVHVGDEYVDRPRQGTRDLINALINAGADVVIGHHPHVVQTVGFSDGKPVFYSIGNMLMRMVTGKPWTEFGMLARIRLDETGATEIAICPFRIHGMDPIALAQDPLRDTIEPHFRAKFVQLLSHAAVTAPQEAAELGPFGSDGCAVVSAAQTANPH